MSGAGQGTGGQRAGGAVRARRTTLAVPGSSPRMIEKARTLAVDEVFLDLEDAVAPLAKADARRAVAAALAEGGWGSRVRAVRVNDWTTPWTFRDVVDVVEAAGGALDCVLLPKVTCAAHVTALDLLLTQVERASGLEVGRIGIEAQIEDARGLLAAAAIAAASPRVEALVLGPVDLMASLGVSAPGGGEAQLHALVSVLVAARAAGVQAIDGPYPAIRDVEGLRRAAARSAALGLDGKWVLHPAQVDAVNEAFGPRQEEYDRAEDVLDAYAWHTSAAGGARGAAMLGEEMIDEASRRLALVVATRGRAAGMARTGAWTPPAS